MRLPLLTLVLAALPCVAADHPLAGDLLRLQDPANAPGRRIAFRAADDAALGQPPAADPRTVGATLEILGSGPDDGSTGPITLTAGGWHGLGTPPGSDGFVFRARSGAAGVRRVV